jgi:hypothetical protein
MKFNLKYLFIVKYKIKSKASKFEYSLNFLFCLSLSQFVSIVFVPSFYFSYISFIKFLDEESKLEALASIETANANSEIEDFVAINETVEEPIVGIFEEVAAPKSVALNENNAKTISFGLNDKIGFEKNLFGGSGEEMNRVISQISTFDTFEEAKDFIEDMVKPDYNNWDGKEDYALRFMEIVERKFE